MAVKCKFYYSSPSTMSWWMNSSRSANFSLYRDVFNLSPGKFKSTLASQFPLNLGGLWDLYLGCWTSPPWPLSTLTLRSISSHAQSNLSRHLGTLAVLGSCLPIPFPKPIQTHFLKRGVVPPAWHVPKRNGRDIQHAWGHPACLNTLLMFGEFPIVLLACWVRAYGFDQGQNLVLWGGKLI